MGHWQLRAESGNGAVFTCGLRADSRPAAEEAARELLPPPFQSVPAWLTVTPMPVRKAQPVPGKHIAQAACD